MKPLFSVGESVVIQSHYYPEYNNREDVVVEVIDTRITKFPSPWDDPVTGSPIWVNSRYVYLLRDNNTRNGKNEDGELNFKVATWGENSLRKKYKPSGDSFESMMYKLNNLIKSSQKLYQKTS